MSRRHYAELLPRGRGIDAVGVFDEEYGLLPTVEEEGAPVAEAEEAATATRPTALLKAARAAKAVAIP